MTIATAAARAGVSGGILQSRKAATKKLLELYNRGKCDTDSLPHLWFLHAGKLRTVCYHTEYKKTLTKVVKREGMGVPADDGFHYKSKSGPCFIYSTVGVSKHALQRWHDRAKRNFMPVEQISKMSEDISAKKLLDDFKNGIIDKDEYFYPYGEGAFIIKLQVPDADYVHRAMIDPDWAHDNCVAANYAWDKRNKWYKGEFLPGGGSATIVTYLGWDELQRGGTFNSMDWYRENFMWKEVSGEFKHMVDEIRDAA